MARSQAIFVVETQDSNNAFFTVKHEAITYLEGTGKLGTVSRMVVDVHSKAALWDERTEVCTFTVETSIESDMVFSAKEMEDAVNRDMEQTTYLRTMYPETEWLTSYHEVFNFFKKEEGD